MASAYPTSLDTLATNKADGTATVTDHAAHHNDLADAINKVEAELGADPSGTSYSTLKGRVADAELGATAWRDIGRHFGPLAIAGGATANTYLLRPNAGDILAAANSANGAFWLDPADYPGGARTTRFRIRGWVITNAVAPAVNFTFGLYPVATFGGTSGNAPTAATLGTVVGATAAINAPSASSQNHVEATAGTVTAGFHAATVALSGTVAANANHTIFAVVQVSQS